MVDALHWEDDEEPSLKTNPDPPELSGQDVIPPHHPPPAPPTSYVHPTEVEFEKYWNGSFDLDGNETNDVDFEVFYLEIGLFEIV